MIPSRSGVLVHSLMTVALIGASSALSATAGAQEPHFGSSDEMVPPVARNAAAAAIAPRITSMRHRWTGDAQEEFRLDIRFSQDVVGFTFGDINVEFGADPVRPLSPVDGSERNYFITMNTWPDYEGRVIITIPSGAARDKATDDRSIAHSYDFQADTRIPEALRAEVVGDELVVTFDEDLDEGSVPPPANFDVFVTRDGDPDTERVSRVDVDATEVILTLARAVRSGDEVEVLYDDVGARALRDRAGNLAEEFEFASVRNNTGEGEAPGAPRSLTATADGVSAIELDWRAPADEGSGDVIGYRIEVSNDGGDAWSTLARSTTSAATRYRHAGLAPNTTRHYRVFAINSFDEGAPSNVASATTGIPLPDAPRGMSARAGSASTIELDWTAPATVRGAPVTGYRIETSTTGRAPWRVLEADTRSGVTTHTHGGLSPGATRHYRVAAINRAGRGPWSNVAKATTDATVPGAPTGLRVAPGGAGGTDRLLLGWTPPASDGGSPVTGYRIEVSPNGVSGWTILVAGTGSAATTFSHTGLAPGTTRHYRVAALNGRGRGAYSNVAQGSTNAARPGQPRNPRARADGRRASRSPGSGRRATAARPSQATASARTARPERGSPSVPTPGARRRASRTPASSRRPATATRSRRSTASAPGRGPARSRPSRIPTCQARRAGSRPGRPAPRGSTCRGPRPETPAARRSAATGSRPPTTEAGPGASCGAPPTRRRPPSPT